MNSRYRQQPLTYLYDYVNKEVIVIFLDGRQIEGTLINYDDRFNLYLTNCTESMHDMNNKSLLTGEVRFLGEVFCRGSNIIDLSLKEGLTRVEEEN